jgi:uncharacterized protein YukE
MAEPLGVTPDELRKTSKQLADVSGRMKHVLTTLQGKLDAAGPAWGNDKTGHEFADGDKGYLGQVDWVNKSVGAKTDLLDTYADQLKSAADTLEQQDQG